MIKNIIFDIGNVILNFDIETILPKFTNDKKQQQFIIDNIINSPEWLKNGLIDTGYISRQQAIDIVQDRTNHSNDDLISYFWNHYNDYSFIDNRVLNIINNLKNNGYKVYLLSNINLHTYNSIEQSGLFNIVDGYILSYQVHKIKPFIGIYNELINKYNIKTNESLIIDDNINNVKTANKLGIMGNKVEPDDFDSIINLLNDFNIEYK